MATSDSHELFDLVPAWWIESVLGLAAVVVGVLAIGLDSIVVGRAIELLSGPASSPGYAVDSVFAYGVAQLLLVVVYVGVGIGVTYAYLTYREFDPGFVVAWPGREAARWLVGLVVLAPALVWGGTLLGSLLGSTGPGSAWDVPGAFVAPRTFGASLALEGVSLLVGGALSIAVIAGVLGPATAALFHGVLQNSLRRVAPTAFAISGTVIAVIALTGGTDPAGVAVVGFVVAAAGYAYEQTGNLAVPMVTYAVLNAVTLTTSLLLVLSAAGQL